jgi:hypothetical protein
MQSMGIGTQVAQTTRSWIERFRAFRRLSTTARPMPEAIEQFEAHLRSSVGASVSTVTEAVQAIERFLAWWRQETGAGGRTQASPRPCKRGVAAQERDPSLPLDEPQGLLGQVRRETMIYTHVLNRGGVPCRSPLDTRAP